MLKLTFTLAVALYAGFIVWGEPPQIAEAEAAVEPTLIASAEADFATPVILGDRPAGSQDAVVTRAAATEIVVPDAATIAASTPAPTLGLEAPRLIGEPVVVSLVRPDVEAPTDVVETRDSGAVLVKVTGSRVNMRAGPSTGNAVVDSLPRGTVAEVIEETDDGWAQIRDVATGKVGYMAARFLEPA